MPPERKTGYSLNSYLDRFVDHVVIRAVVEMEPTGRAGIGILEEDALATMVSVATTLC